MSLTESKSIDLDTVISYLLANSAEIEYRFCQKHVSLSLRLSLWTGHHLLGVSVHKELNSEKRMTVTRYDKTERNNINSHAKAQ